MPVLLSLLLNYRVGDYMIKLNRCICVCWFFSSTGQGARLPGCASLLLQPGESVLPYICLAGTLSWPGSRIRLDILYPVPENTLLGFLDTV